MRYSIGEYLDNFGTNTATLGDPLDIALEKLKDHPSIKIVKENVSTESLFHFAEIIWCVWNDKRAFVFEFEESRNFRWHPNLSA